MARRHGSPVNPSRNRPVPNTILRHSDSAMTIRIVLTGGRLTAFPAFPERFAPCLKTCLRRQSKHLPLAVHARRFVAGPLDILDIGTKVGGRLPLRAPL